MSIKQTFLKAGKSISKHSPAIFTGVGIVGLGATAYFAYKSRDKVEVVVENIEEKRDNDLPVNKMEVAKDLAVSLYLPITVGVASGLSILMAHRIQRKRIMALTGALAAQQAQNLYFENKYKKKHGEKAFNEFMTPTREQKVETTDSKGNKKEKVEEVKIDQVDPTIGQWYDESSEYASDDHGYNMAYIDSVSETLQTRLFHRGTLLLNEVREELGFERIRAGALLGWTTADNFDIRKSITNLGETDKGELKEQIFVSWTPARYIYNELDLNGGRYSI